MKQQNRYIIAWASGHQPPRTVFFRTTGKKGWCGTYEREEATRFKTVRQAKEMFESKHLWLEDFDDDWQTGALRIEPSVAPMLPFASKEQ